MNRKLINKLCLYAACTAVMGTSIGGVVYSVLNVNEQNQPLDFFQFNSIKEVFNANFDTEKVNNFGLDPKINYKDNKTERGYSWFNSEYLTTISKEVSKSSDYINYLVGYSALQYFYSSIIVNAHPDGDEEWNEFINTMSNDQAAEYLSTKVFSQFSFSAKKLNLKYANDESNPNNFYGEFEFHFSAKYYEYNWSSGEKTPVDYTLDITYNSDGSDANDELRICGFGLEKLSGLGYPYLPQVDLESTNDKFFYKITKNGEPSSHQDNYLWPRGSERITPSAIEIFKRLQVATHS